MFGNIRVAFGAILENLRKVAGNLRKKKEHYTLQLKIMMQRTANENAACQRRICKRSDQPKRERLVNNDARLILRGKLKVIPLK